MKRDYSMAMEKLDITRINKIYAILEDETTSKENYWDRVRKLTKRVTSDHSIGRWQCLAEYYERYVIPSKAKPRRGIYAFRPHLQYIRCQDPSTR